MSRSQRAKLLLVSLLTMLLVGGLSGIYIERFLSEWVESRISDELQREGAVARLVLQERSVGFEPALADPVADELHQLLAVRVTLVGPDGRVVGDSQLELSQLDGVPNHAARPELALALQGRIGTSRRFSETVQQRLLYVAVPYEHQGQSGAVRLAAPIEVIAEHLNRVHWALMWVGVLAIGMVVVMTGLQSHVASRALRGIVQSARGVTAGQTRRLVVKADDDLGLLAGSFNELIDELEVTVNKLSGERDRLETILQGMTEAVVALDEHDRITHVNSAAMELLGVSGDAERKLLIEAARIPPLAELMERVHSEGGAAAEFELDLSRRRRVLARAAPVRVTGGTILVMLDITELRRLEQVRRDFVANVSHELRTPVSVIQANAETLLDGALSDSERGPVFLNAILRSSQRLAQLVSDLLDLSRIESGHYALAVSPVNVLQVLNKVAPVIELSAAAKRIQLVVDVPPELVVLADASALEQVLVNLLDNAVKYTPGGGHVRVQAKQCKQVEIEVIDDGAGIEPRHRVRIFERFYRVDPGRSREMGGTGLGLAIVKHLVGAMGGEVIVTGAPQGGSLFRVTLPRAVATTSAA